MSLAGMLNCAHNLWRLHCHSLWCGMVYQYYLHAYGCIIMRASPPLPMGISPPNFRHDLLLLQYLGARANSKCAQVCPALFNIIHHIHQSVEENTDSEAGGTEDK